MSGVIEVSREGPEVVVSGTEQLLFALAAALADREIVPTRFQVEQTTLDDAFLALTGRPLDAVDEGDA